MFVRLATDIWSKSLLFVDTSDMTHADYSRKELLALWNELKKSELWPTVAKFFEEIKAVTVETMHDQATTTRLQSFFREMLQGIGVSSSHFARLITQNYILAEPVKATDIVGAFCVLTQSDMEWLMVVTDEKMHKIAPFVVLKMSQAALQSYVDNGIQVQACGDELGSRKLADLVKNDN